MSVLHVSLGPIDDVATLRSQWFDLYARSQASFFLSWHWIGNWLHVRPTAAEVLRLTVYREGRVVGLALLHRATLRRHGVLTSRMLALHEYLPPGPNVMMEYNGVLAEAGLEAEVTRAVVRQLANQATPWDELQLSGVPVGSGMLDSSFLDALKLDCLRVGESATWQVDLERVRNLPGGYLEALTRKTRHKLRKYLRQYAALGPLAVDQAHSPEEALDFFAALKALHQRHWQQRGRPGSFANPVWEQFHRGVIASAFATGGVQLLRLRAGEQTVGYLYNLLQRGEVCMIQSGYAYDADENLHPGFVCVYAAVEHNARLGHGVFDLLAGDAQYKRMLADRGGPLFWLRLRHRRLKFRAEDAARWVSRKLRAQSDDVTF